MTTTCYVCKQVKPAEEMCTNRKCKPCMVVYRKAWYENNKERIKQQHEGYKRLNREKLKRANIAYRERNKEREKIRTAKYSKDYPERRAESEQRRRARKRGSQTIKLTKEMLDGRLAVFGWCCSYCGGKFEHWDHLKPLELGGPHILSNLRPSCARCNLCKGIIPPIEWLQRIKS
jgi:hypothetical protein